MVRSIFANLYIFMSGEYCMSALLSKIEVLLSFENSCFACSSVTHMTSNQQLQLSLQWCCITVLVRPLTVFLCLISVICYLLLVVVDSWVQVNSLLPPVTV